MATRTFHPGDQGLCLMRSPKPNQLRGTYRTSDRSSCDVCNLVTETKVAFWQEGFACRTQTLYERQSPQDERQLSQWPNRLITGHVTQ